MLVTYTRNQTNMMYHGHSCALIYHGDLNINTYTGCLIDYWKVYRPRVYGSDSPQEDYIEGNPSLMYLLMNASKSYRSSCVITLRRMCSWV